MKTWFACLTLFRYPATLLIITTIFLSACTTPVTTDSTPSPTLLTDHDQDGFPDAAELVNENDRVSFRRWFTTIAESQFYFYHPHWPKIRRDCTGLICFAYKEALKKHNRSWFKKYKYLTDPAIPEIRAYHYPHVPILGTALFRTQGQSFKPSDLTTQTSPPTFQPIATAQILMDYNCRYLGHQLDDSIESGDILFFRYSQDDKILFHAMILVTKMENQDPQYENDFDGIVVYHTGPDYNSPGEVRKLSISSLNLHPDDTWHVKPYNPHFLGFFRFHILDSNNNQYNQYNQFNQYNQYNQYHQYNHSNYSNRYAKSYLAEDAP